MQKQIAGWGLILVMSVGLAAAGAPRATASAKGRRNTTIVLGAATVGAALTHHKTAAILLGAGTAVSYVRYRDAVRRDHRRARMARAGKYARVAAYRTSRYHVSYARASYARTHVASRPSRAAACCPPAATKVVYVTQPAPVAPAEASMPLAAPAPAPAPASQNPALPAGAIALGAGAALTGLGFAGRRLLKRRGV